jgi:ubiquinone/menaquinone biosynthesis C-methylase UbiE
MANAVKFWNKMARKYSRDAIKDMASYEYTLERTRSYLKPTDRVLELGAGTSSTAMLLAGDVATYTASDISSEMVAIGREKLTATPISGLEIKAGDLKTFADDTGVFDVVMGFNLFHLVDNPTGAFSQIRGMLAQDGLFISKTACLADEPKFLKRMMFRVMVAVVGTLRLVPRPIHCFRVRELEAMIENAGFEIVESGNHPVSPPSRYIVARKV